MSISPDSLIKALNTIESNAQAQVQEGKSNPIFFKLTKEDKKLWILGTRHDLSIKALHPKAIAILKTTNCLTSEVGNTDRKNNTTPLCERFRSQEEPVWYNSLPLSLRTFLEQHTPLLGLLQDKLEHLAYNSVRYLSFFDNALELLGMDAQLTYLQQDHKPIYALDPEDMEAFADPKIEKKNKLIRYYVAKINEMQKLQQDNPYINCNENISVYKSRLEGFNLSLKTKATCYMQDYLGALPTAYARYLTGDVSIPEIEENLSEMQAQELANRNHFWATKLIVLLTHYQSIGVVVGMFHLDLNMDSLVPLLQRLGFRVERLNSDGTFTHWHSACSTKMSMPPRQALTFSFSQILKTPEWMQAFSTQQQAKEFVQRYRKQYLKKGQNGYGANALILHTPGESYKL
jgi:hypothetical protein